MRQRPTKPSSSRPLVGVVVDGVSVYGRATLMGVMRYANLRRRWVLHTDLWREPVSLAHFPKCDGAIIAGIGGSAFDEVRSRCRHVIVCSGAFDPLGVPSVALDDHATGRLAAEHLLNCRLENFAFYGNAQQRTVAQRRLQGFRDRLAEQAYTCHECPVVWPSGLEWMTHAHHPELIRWLRELPKPIGILGVDDLLANDLSAACLQAGIGVPDHVAIVGVNNDELLCEAAWPPLSSVEADFSRMGYAAAEVLDRLISGEKLGPDERCVRLPPLGVVQRVSTNVLAVEDPHLADAVRYIREHACDPCSVQDVLRHVPVGRRWLERQFAAQLGRTPHDEIIRVRMETAQRLLLEPRLAMPEIAEACGFSASQNFARAFAAIVGVTPAAYRRRATRGQVPESLPADDS